MEQNAQLSRQLEKMKIEAGKLEERSSVHLNLDKAIHENSGLHAEFQNKSKNEQFQQDLKVERDCIPLRLPLYPLNSSTSESR